MISKEDFMELISLRRQGCSNREIARTLGIHRSTVKRHLERGEFPRYRKTRRRESILTPYIETIRDFLEEDDYQSTWIFDRIKAMGDAGGYDTVKNHVRVIKEQKTRLAYIRFETEPGRQGQFDWGDFQVTEPDGRVTTVFGFLLVLGYSRGMYAEYTGSCTLETFMDCHIQAFHYLGGVPTEILYDNMKHVVIGRDEHGKPIFNPEFLHFAHHYGFQPKAAPPYSPWVKGKVERPMDYLRERFWRGHTFICVEQTNRDLASWLDEGRLAKKTEGSLEIEFPDNFLFVDRLQEAGKKRELQALAEEFCGRKVSLVISVAPAESFGTGDQKERLSRAQMLERTRQEARSHPLVKEALILFQGQITEIKVSDS